MRKLKGLARAENLQDCTVQSYVRATRSTGGMVTTTVVLAVGKAIVRTHNKHLLDEEGDT